GDDAAGPGGDLGRGRGPAVPGAVVRGGGPAGAEADAADGRAALQDARDGAQGGVGAPAGVPPDPGDEGGRGAASGPGAFATELQGGGADGERLRGHAVDGGGGGVGGPAPAGVGDT